jgi:hypothetical protein
MNRPAALAFVAVLALAACSSAAAPTPQIVYVTSVPASTPVEQRTETPASTPTPAPTPTPTSTPVPTPNREAVASRYAKITTAMESAVKKAWVYGSGITSLAQFKSYYKAIYAALQRWDTNLRGSTYPADTQADFRILLQRLSSAMVLAYAVPQQDTYYGAADYHQKALAAWNALLAAEQIVGKDLGLTYGP